MTLKKKDSSKETRYAWSKFQQSPDPSELPIPYCLLNIKKNENDKENTKNK